MAHFRKSKKIGGVRFTVSKSGISGSVGAGPVRVTRGADGKVRRTIRGPKGTGISDTRRVSGSSKRTSSPAENSASEQSSAGDIAKILGTPSSAPLASSYQRALVWGLLDGKVTQRALKRLTIEQAAMIVRGLGQDPKQLRQGSRDGLLPWGAARKTRRRWWSEHEA